MRQMQALVSCSMPRENDEIPNRSCEIPEELVKYIYSKTSSNYHTVKPHRMPATNVIDIWRFLNPNTTEFTYIDPSCNMRNSRIDLLLCSNAFKSKCTKSVITQAPAPDHRAVSVSVQITRNKRGKGYWKLNNSFLEHEEYHDEIEYMKK